MGLLDFEARAQEQEVANYANLDPNPKYTRRLNAKPGCSTVAALQFFAALQFCAQQLVSWQAEPVRKHCPLGLPVLFGLRIRNDCFRPESLVG